MARSLSLDTPSYPTIPSLTWTSTTTSTTTSTRCLWPLERSKAQAFRRKSFGQEPSSLATSHQPRRATPGKSKWKVKANDSQWIEIKKKIIRMRPSFQNSFKKNQRIFGGALRKFKEHMVLKLKYIGLLKLYLKRPLTKMSNWALVISQRGGWGFPEKIILSSLFKKSTHKD